MYALVDCNNFYVSCERVFNPGLENMPVIVLSNNDGCAISRSDEAKALGIEMGAIPHLIPKTVDISFLKMFSSNYTLYGDMSDRVMKTLAQFVPRLEIYSIDESFLDLSGMAHLDLLQLGSKIKYTIKKNCGIPVCVGIAPTKALAKMANRYAKKTNKDFGVYWAKDETAINKMLHGTKVGDVWNIGHQYERMLLSNNIKTAYDFAHAAPDFVRTNMTVQGARLQKELNSIVCFEWEFEPPAKKGICVGRSFGFLTSDKKIVCEAMTNFAASCALKLRVQNSVTKEIKVFINTNPHRPQDTQCFRSIVLQLELATNTTTEIIKYALKGLDIIFKEGCNYMKCGIEVRNLIPENNIQFSLFTGIESSKKKQLTKAFDQVNLLHGKDTVKYGVQGFEKRYKARAAHLSPCFTTRIKDIIKTKD